MWRRTEAVPHCLHESKLFSCCHLLVTFCGDAIFSSICYLYWPFENICSLITVVSLIRAYHIAVHSLELQNMFSVQGPVQFLLLHLRLFWPSYFWYQQGISPPLLKNTACNDFFLFKIPSINTCEGNHLCLMTSLPSAVSSVYYVLHFTCEENIYSCRKGEKPGCVKSMC